VKDPVMMGGGVGRNGPPFEARGRGLRVTSLYHPLRRVGEGQCHDREANTDRKINKVMKMTERD
jgi:hypothetical protein